jgi:BolA protein
MVCAGLPSSLDNTDLAFAAPTGITPPIHACLRAAGALRPTTSRPIKAAMRTEDVITRKLTDAFAPQSLEVVDESHQHAGHAGHRPGGQTHFRIYIVARAFQGKSRLDRHRMINAILAPELAGGVHALAIHAAAPGEGV